MHELIGDAREEWGRGWVGMGGLSPERSGVEAGVDVSDRCVKGCADESVMGGRSEGGK